MDMQDELIDRFGELPVPVENLLLIASVKALAHSAGVTEVNINRQEARITMFKQARIDVTGIPDLISRYRGDLKLRPGDIPEFIYLDQRNKNRDCQRMIEKTQEILRGLKELCGNGKNAEKRKESGRA